MDNDMRSHMDIIRDGDISTKERLTVAADGWANIAPTMNQRHLRQIPGGEKAGTLAVTAMSGKLGGLAAKASFRMDEQLEQKSDGIRQKYSGPALDANGRPNLDMEPVMQPVGEIEPPAPQVDRPEIKAPRFGMNG